MLYSKKKFRITQVAKNKTENNKSNEFTFILFVLCDLKLIVTENKIFFVGLIFEKTFLRKLCFGEFFRSRIAFKKSSCSRRQLFYGKNTAFHTIL